MLGLASTQSVSFGPGFGSGSGFGGCGPARFSAAHPANRLPSPASRVPIPTSVSSRVTSSPTKGRDHGRNESVVTPGGW
jgi:hypothetical protein